MTGARKQESKDIKQRLREDQRDEGMVGSRVVDSWWMGVLLHTEGDRDRFSEQGRDREGYWKKIDQKQTNKANHSRNNCNMQGQFFQKVPISWWWRSNTNLSISLSPLNPRARMLA